jgi:ABC-type transporter MlaC component
VGKNRKAKKRLQQARKRGGLKQRLKLSTDRQVIAAERLALARTAYENSCVELWRDASPEQREALEEMYQRTARESLQEVYKQRIIAALTKQ